MISVWPTLFFIVRIDVWISSQYPRICVPHYFHPFVYTLTCNNVFIGLCVSVNRFKYNEYTNEMIDGIEIYFENEWMLYNRPQMVLICTKSFHERWRT